MNSARLPIRSLALLLVAASALAQDTPAPAPIHKPRTPRPEQPPYNVNMIFLDPAHGGDDPGARLGPNSLEKDATLAFAERLRTLLSRDAFTLVTTRSQTPDPTDPASVPNLDQRVEIANRSRALACLVLHATAAGHGIHLFTSSLPAPAPSSAETSGTRPIVPWNTAQAASLSASQQLASDLAAAIDGLRIPLVTGHASVKPIDSLTCPAILVELAPLASGASQTSASDPAYQQRVAQALAAGLHAWRAHAQAQLDTQAQIKAQMQAQAQSAPSKPDAPKPKPTPQPRRIPEEFPEVAPPTPVAPPRPPAPILRRPPPPLPAPVPAPTPPPGARP